VNRARLVQDICTSEPYDHGSAAHLFAQP